MQAGVTVAGDHEGIARIVGLDQPPQRQRDALDMLLGLDPERPFGERRADDLGSVGEPERRNRTVGAARPGLVRFLIDDADARALAVQIAASVFWSKTWS